MIEPYVHVITGLAVCSRIADVWTTYLVTPTLKLEANSLVRRFGWRFALLTIAVGLLSYVWPPLGVVIFTASFLVAASNASKIVTAKALGEQELVALLHRALLDTPLWPGLLFLIMPGIFIGVIGGSLLFFYREANEWAYYFGVGMLMYSLAVFIWYPIQYYRIRKEARNKSNKALEEA